MMVYRPKKLSRKRPAWQGTIASLSSVPEWLFTTHRPKVTSTQNTETIQRWSRLGAGLFTCLLIVCTVRTATLQVARGDSYLALSNDNRIRDEISYAPRGRIMDRNGKVLASNNLRFQLTVTPYLLARDRQDREQAYRTASAIIPMSLQTIREQAEDEGLNYTRPLLITPRLTHTQTLRLEQKLPHMEGFSVDTIPVRQYTADVGLSHILGYVGKVNKADLSRQPELLPTDYVGRSGIEAYYDTILRGTNGHQRVEVDALGRPLRLLAKENARIGNDIRLTIDYHLQKKLEEELQKQLHQTGAKRASGIAIDPRNGEILAMVSIPYYDNNLFAQGISSQDYTRLVQDQDKPLINRTIAGTYPSGSTIKPLVAAAALEEHVVTPQTIIVDRGYIDIPNRYNPALSYRFRGWRPGGLGPMNVRRALAYSSNIYFYTVGGGHGSIAGLGANRLTDYYHMFGLGQKTGVDLGGEVTGYVPTPQSKQKRTGEQWYLGDTYNISIGQGDLRLTPMQMLRAHAAVANGGMLIQPHLLKEWPSTTSTPTDWSTKRLAISDNTISEVRAGMHDMPYHGVFPPERFASIPVQIAGKTGTAQASNPGGGGQPHAWFIAFAPYEKPKISILALIENVHSSTIAITPVVNTLADYFD